MDSAPDTARPQDAPPRALLLAESPYFGGITAHLLTLHAALEARWPGVSVLASLSGRREDANGYAFLAETHFEASDMALHAQVMKRYRGLMKGGETGKRLVRESEDWMRRQGVVSPARLAAMFLPVIEMED